MSEVDGAGQPDVQPPLDWPGAPGSARPRLAGSPAWQAGLKQSPESFRVDEELGFDPSGAGNHWLMRLEKRDMATGALVDWIAKVTGTRARDIGFSGLKDRHAVTTQWLSVPHESFDPAAFERACAEAGVGLLALDRHDRKLRRGTHRANRFRLRLHDVAPVHESEAPDLAGYLAERAPGLASRGMANYFGEQRYGRYFGNLRGLVEWGQGIRTGRPKRQARNWLLSTLRSAIFDRVLADRVASGGIDRVEPGDLLQLAGSRSRFLAEADELDVLEARLAQGDVMPTGPLWGEGASPAGDGVAARENALATEMLARFGEATWRQWLSDWRVEADRRPLAVRVTDLEYGVEDGAVELAFSLPPGSYATELVAELFTVTSSD
ncbi:tRNA pseudouridine(13) synthase TruD [Guyparkeria hydrothermalis]|uniref:tRNA pseudouridine(13) synthase TruD n=1 Tax=Guyparkeria TaxID=2035712 RepID=UPI0010AD2550|nr:MULTISPECIES: tRNA pseudouridine(13) synthase TruD [Guyparkeria]MCL7750000.1 tRNA pseudouridine(13) synthase TruD [Guyparkeria hydrothermalis]TKA89740.1 tRNA pseudouridine(13) synthase TruD [Guyparkeria sp. SB14A]